MKLILTQEVTGLGSAGDVVEVKDGYGRNFLIPRGFAMSTSLAGSLVPALAIFIAVYALMATLTWVLYVRPGSAFAAEGV